MRSFHCLTVLAAACIATLAGAREPQVKLPDIGSSAAAIMSPQDMHDYGAAMLQEMRAYDMILDDALLTDYINALGWRLVANSDRPDMSFTFFIVRDEQINAFAAPGGFVAANAGLITAMQSEDELAGVLAHEIAHVQQQHLLRAFEDTKKMSVPIMLGMLGVLVASSHRSDDAGMAAVMTGTQMIQQRQINFTRSDEAEADRVGIKTMARAGFDPMAMAGAFQTLQKVMRVNGVDVPEFLLDHPLDTKRIADAKARAAQLEGEAAEARRKNLTSATDLAQLGASLMPSLGATSARAPAAAPAPTNDGPAYFELMRERARVLTAPSATAMRAYYADNLRDDKPFDTTANRYGYALALVRSREAKLAVEQLTPLVEKQPTSSVLRLALAHAEEQAGNQADALKTYERLNSDFPGNHAVILSYADALLASADARSAQRALGLLRPLIERYSDDPELQKSYGRANQLAGDKVRAAEAYAEAAYLTGHAEDALNQLKALSKQPDLTYYQRSRIDARITQLTPTVLELRKRRSDAPADARIGAAACCRTD